MRLLSEEVSRSELVKEFPSFLLKQQLSLQLAKKRKLKTLFKNVNLDVARSLWSFSKDGSRVFAFCEALDHIRWYEEFHLFVTKKMDYMTFNRALNRFIARRPKVLDSLENMMENDERDAYVFFLFFYLRIDLSTKKNVFFAESLSTSDLVECLYLSMFPTALLSARRRNLLKTFSSAPNAMSIIEKALSDRHLPKLRVKQKEVI